MSQSAGIYSNLKSAWHYVRDGGMPNAPKQVQFIISDLCNQDCSFCAYRMSGYSSNEMFMGDSEASAYGHDNPKRWIPEDKAISLLRDFKAAGVLGIQFTGGGEPTANPRHEAIFSAALEMGFKCALVSNGLRWSDSLISMLARFAWVRVSVDAGTAETYARTRNTPRGNFEKVWGHVARLAHAIRTPTPSGCVLGIGYVVTPENWKEIGKGVELAAGSGAAYIRLSAMFNPDGAKPYDGIYVEILASIEAARGQSERPGFVVHDLFGDRIEDLVDGPPDYPVCFYQHYNTYVGGDLNVYRCCVLAYNKRGLLGSVKDRTYGEFLADPETQEKLKNFDARGCEMCQFNQKNRVMNYLVNGKPEHAEFP